MSRLVNNPIRRRAFFAATLAIAWLALSATAAAQQLDPSWGRRLSAATGCEYTTDAYKLVPCGMSRLYNHCQSWLSPIGHCKAKPGFESKLQSAKTNLMKCMQIARAGQSVAMALNAYDTARLAHNAIHGGYECPKHVNVGITGGKYLNLKGPKHTWLGQVKAFCSKIQGEVDGFTSRAGYDKMLSSRQKAAVEQRLATARSQLKRCFQITGTGQSAAAVWPANAAAQALANAETTLRDQSSETEHEAKKQKKAKEKEFERLQHAEYLAMIEEHNQQVAAMGKPTQNAKELLRLAKKCAAKKVRSSFPSGDPTLNSGSDCKPEKGRNMVSNMRECHKKAWRNLNSVIRTLTKLINSGGLLERASCGIRGAWANLKKSLKNLKDAGVEFFRELIQCVSEAKRVITLQPYQVKDQKLRSEYQGIWNKLKNMTLSWKRLNPGAVLKECKEALVAAGKVLKRVKETGQAGIDLLKAGIKTAKEILVGEITEAKCDIAEGLWKREENCCYAQGLIKCTIESTKEAIKDAWNVWCAKTPVRQGLCKLVEAGAACWRSVKYRLKEIPAYVRNRLQRMSGLLTKLKSLGSVVWGGLTRPAMMEALSYCKERGKEALVDLAWGVCKQYGGRILGFLNDKLQQLVNWVGGKLRGFTYTMTGPQIGNAVCGFNKMGEAIRRFGKNLTLTVRVDKLSAGGSGKFGLSLGLSLILGHKDKPGDNLTLSAGATITVKPGVCDMNGPMFSVRLEVDKFTVSKTPSWVGGEIARAIQPKIGCLHFCQLKPIELGQGLKLRLNYCKMIDNCLKSKCTAPVINTLLAKLFPIQIGTLGSMIGPKTPGTLKNWGIGVGGVRFSTNTRDPYAPAVNATVSIGPPGVPSFSTNVGATLGITTYCRSSGEGMIKVCPSIALKVGDFPKEMQQILKQTAQTSWDQMVATDRKTGEFVYYWKELFADGGPKEESMFKKVALELVKKAADSLLSKLGKLGGSGWGGKITGKIEGWLRSAFSIQGGGGESKDKCETCSSQGGACKSDKDCCFDYVCSANKTCVGSGGYAGDAACMRLTKEDIANSHGPGGKVGKFEVGSPISADPPSPTGTSSAPPARDDLAGTAGHITGSGVTLRRKPTRWGPGSPLGYLNRCQAVQILQSGIRGKRYTWTQVKVKGNTGYVASTYVKEGSCGGRSVTPVTSRPPRAAPPKPSPPPKPTGKRPSSTRCPRGQRYNASLRRCVGGTPTGTPRCRWGTVWDSRKRKCVYKARSPKRCRKGQTYNSWLRKCVAKRRPATGRCARGKVYDRARRRCVAKAQRIPRPTRPTRPPAARPPAPPSRATPPAPPSRATPPAPPSQATPPASPPAAAEKVGYVNGSGVTFREKPMQWGSRPLGYLYRCQALKILEQGIRGGGLTWTKVTYKGKVGYVASQYVKEGSCR